jgi:hypothetical protein
MKHSISGMLALLAGAYVVHGQGTVSFANYLVLTNYIYVGFDIGSAGRGFLGGTDTGPPPTLFNYASETGNGNAWTVQLYGAVGANLPVSALSPLAGITANFANGSFADATAGTWFSSAVASFSNAANGTVATLQLYAWYNAGGAISNYAQAVADGVPLGYGSTANVILGGTNAIGPPSPPAFLPASLSFDVFSELDPYYETFLTWTNIAPLTYGTALTTNQLNAVAADVFGPVAGTFYYSPPLGAVLNAGTNTLSVAFSPPIYTYEYSGAETNATVVVSPAPLNVTASNAIWVVGQTFPVLTGAITGVTNGDNITATYSCSATTNSPVGTYPIVPALVDPGDRRTNYTVSLVNGTLTIVERPELQTATLANGKLSLTWSAEVGGAYQLQSNSDLSSTNWTSLGSAIIANGTTLNTSDFITNAPQRFYRLALRP